MCKKLVAAVLLSTGCATTSPPRSIEYLPALRTVDVQTMNVHFLGTGYESYKLYICGKSTSSSVSLNCINYGFFSTSLRR